MKKGVIYARYSSDKQTEQSISGQLTVCYDYAKKNDITIVAEYIDRAMTGKNDDRPEFLRMLKDSGKKQWEYVIVYKLDRFSRNRYDSAVHGKTLKKNGVKRLSATENISDSPEGIMMEAMLEGMAEYYSAELSQKINRGLNENVKKGLMVGGSVTFGYDMIDKKLVVNEETAEYVRLIFSMYRDGETMQNIILFLNSKGVLNINGKEFSHQHISKLLHNKRYIGTFTYRGIEHENYIEPLIDMETWLKVQAKLKSARNYGKAKSTTTFYLTGKLFCGHCGGSMSGIGGTSRYKARRHYYYTCRNKDKKNEKKEELEELIVSITMQYILKSDFLEELIDQIVDSGNKIELSIYNDIERMKKLINSNNRKLKNIMAAVKKGIISSTLQGDLLKLEEANEQLKLDIAKKKNAKTFNMDRDKILYFFEKLSTYNKKDTRIVEFILKTFIKRVTVWDNGDITIEYHLPSPPKTFNRANYDDKMVLLNATHLHQHGRQKNPIGFTSPHIYVYGNSIFITVSIKKEP